LIIWIDNVRLALLACAWLVAFFPILSNTTVGLNSSDHNLRDMFRLYRATPRQTLLKLRVPSAMPYFLTGVRISGGLSLTGAVVAEFVAGTSGQGSGLAYRILESSYQLQTPRMFAALLLISLTGVLIFLATSAVSQRILGRWHESAMDLEK
ncbi:MAG: ABC transporter permease subunit, partial [Nitratireductor sp.]